MIVLFGCLAQAASIVVRVAGPVEVALPIEAKVIGVGHRNPLADSERFPTLAAEAERTHEFENADFMAAEAAVLAASERLGWSGRFDVSALGVLPTGPRRGVVAPRLIPSQTRQLCAEHGLDALLVLEGLDTDVVDESESRLVGDVRLVEGVREINGRAVWRTYLCDGSLADEYAQDGDLLRVVERASTTGDDAEIWARLGAMEPAMLGLGERAGQVAGDRLSPRYTSVGRLWVRGSAKHMRRGAKHIEKSQYDEAIREWSLAFDKGGSRQRGRAAYNLAVMAERSGDLELATGWMDRSAAGWHSKRVTRYRELLDFRRSAQESSPEPDEALELAMPEGLQDGEPP